MSSEIKLHPLVLMNISDHLTRSRLLHGETAHIVGALMGSQEGRTIQLTNSHEVPLESSDRIDKEFFIKKQALYKQVFPELEFQGWYTSQDCEINLSLNKQVKHY
jgi:COP9 signalosome complex subunit 6